VGVGFRHQNPFFEDSAQALIESMEENARQSCGISYRKMSTAELHLYNMRHALEHGAALSFFLGQRAGTPNE
jgi:hypothetical protein